ncbi:TRAP transporter substrate-binding protein [uncultured Oscillibacter sp.]|uniref:TRAP transporter substrate-binding protein n=1 Tax=uncultured Oscillibacter sp. TaxID=876091 RepID=UPI0025D27A87|nr:TRAP transporter substrate-binding protein [uncultured Oscillibacter sp.]
MKKRFTALFLALAMCLSLAACGSKPADTSGTSGSTQPDGAAQSQPPADAPAGAEYTEITLQLAHYNAVDQPIHLAVEEWAEMLKERSGGAVQLDIYPAASLYNQTDGQDAIIMGTLDMFMADTSVMSNDEPEYALFSLPFLIEDYDAAAQIVYGEIGREIDRRMQDNLGVVALGWTWNGFRNMCTADPITSVADCKGYKLRSPGADIYLDTFNTLGMSPNVISWSEAYTAMQSGVVDGVESVLEAFYTQGFYELGRNICLSRHMLSIIGPTINADKWDSLNEATQELLLDTWAECQAELNDTVISNESGYQQSLADAGCNITEFGDRQELVELFTDYWTKNAEAGGYADLLEEAMTLIGG